jgi:hypothetical protein
MGGRGRVLFQHPLTAIASKDGGDTRIFSEIVAGALGRGRDGVPRV